YEQVVARVSADGDAETANPVEPGEIESRERAKRQYVGIERLAVGADMMRARKQKCRRECGQGKGRERGPRLRPAKELEQGGEQQQAEQRFLVDAGAQEADHLPPQRLGVVRTGELQRCNAMARLAKHVVRA